MVTIASIAGIASLIGDPARATMLVSLMDGRALTAGELGQAAGVAPPTASGHLARLLDAGLLALERQGRHRYYRIADASVAELVENLMSVTGELAANRSKPISAGPRDLALRRARLCYDHLAGEVAVAIAGSMVSRGQLDFSKDGGAVTAQGMNFLASIGVDLATAARPRRATFCRPCLDWSERRPHVAGVVGRALYETFERQGWVRKPSNGRVVAITPVGLTELSRHFGLTFQ